MKHKSKIIAVVIFAAIFLAGWEFGVSPLRESLLTAKKQGEFLQERMLRRMAVNIPSDYITKNQYDIDIIHYDLNLDLYPENKFLKGEAELTGLLLNKKLEQIDLNFYDNLKISKITFNGNPSPFVNEKTKLSIPVVPGVNDTFRIKIIYEGTPKRSGLSAFVFGEINKKSVVYNLNEPTFASTWFPCNDFPSDKALLDIKITNDTSKTSVSNGILVSESSSGSRKTYHWKTYYPVSTYLICLYSADYESFKQSYISQDKADTMDIHYYVFPDHMKNAKRDFEEHPEMLDFFSKTFGEYPFIKEKYGVAEFLWQMGAMEHQTITGIGSNFVSGRKFYTDVYVHELAHHWWGNAVGPETWNDIWLNEGFATYSEALYFEYSSGKRALQSTMRSKFQDNFSGVLSQPGEFLFSSTVYDKGAWVLHMLRREIGDSAFFNLLRTYFEMFKYKTASTKDFTNLAERLSGKKLDKFFEQWLDGNGTIRADYTWSIKPEDGKYIVKLNINQLQEEYRDYHFPLDVELEYDNKNKNTRKTFYIDSRQKSIEFLVDTRPNSLILDPDNWLLATFIDMNPYE
ncbi:MAG: M1 family metallopeptidase [Ignavibacteriaceae bacterium]